MTNVIGAIAAVGDELSATLNANDVLTLGPFSFTDFAVPEKMPWGGQQKLNVHKLIGGTRIIDAMGRDDAPIEWEGIFLSPDADDQAQSLDALRIAGTPLQLSWGTHSYVVVIEEFKPVYKYSSMTRYGVRVIVLYDAPVTAQPSLIQSVTSDIGSVVGDITNGLGSVVSAITDGIGSAINDVTDSIGSAISDVTDDLSDTLDSVQSALGSVTPLLQTAVGLSGGSPIALSILSGVNAAQSIVSSASDAADDVITGFSDAISLASPSVDAYVDAINNTFSAVGQAAYLAQTGAYLGRAAVNLIDPTT